MSSDLRVERPRELRLASTKPKSRVSFNEPVASTSGTSLVVTHSPKKLRLDPDFKPRRKRSWSCTFSCDKRRRNWSFLPTKFLLGGSITDPLNLEALSQEDDSSPYMQSQKDKPQALIANSRVGGGTIKVIIPPNINDPLNLDACSEDGEGELADAIYRQRRRRKIRPNRKRRNSEPSIVATDSEEDNHLSVSFDDDILKDDVISVAEPADQTSSSSCSTTNTRPTALRQLSCPAVVVSQPSTDPSLTAQSAKVACTKKLKANVEDKIVSPVLPKRCLERKKHSSQQKPVPDTLPQEAVQPPKTFNPKNRLYQYGNYHQYYGYRNPDNAIDPRLKFLKREWIQGKDILDIGCNIGHISLTLARDFAPTKVVGIDIDKKLVGIAKKNVKHYFHRELLDEAPYPNSMRLLYGPLKPPANPDGSRSFPHNVKFFQSNYVLETDELLQTVKEEFDVVLCLSVTKWVHMNWGDSGLKRFFQRVFKNLRAGGLFVLEPQAWPSYKKKRKLTPEIFENFKNIKFFPDSFEDYLTKEIGFYSINRLSVNHHFSRGFTRPLHIFRKPSDSRKNSAQSSPKDQSADLTKHDESLAETLQKPTKEGDSTETEVSANEKCKIQEDTKSEHSSETSSEVPSSNVDCVEKANTDEKSGSKQIPKQILDPTSIAKIEENSLSASQTSAETSSSSLVKTPDSINSKRTRCDSGESQCKKRKID